MTITYNDQVLTFLETRADLDTTEAAQTLDSAVPCPEVMRQFSPEKRISIAQQYGYRKLVWADRSRS